MRRLLGLLLIGAMFVLPIVTSCVPSGYEGKNPARPAGNQLSPEQQQNSGGTAPTDTNAGAGNTSGGGGSQSENPQQGGQ